MTDNINEDRGGEQESSDPPSEVGNSVAPAGTTGLLAGVGGMLHQEAVEKEERWPVIFYAEAVSAESVAGLSKAEDCRSR
jgi:hypothetical protein